MSHRGDLKDMTKQQRLEIKIVFQNQKQCYTESIVGSLRYETLRKLTPRQYTELHKRNMAGENFDEMVDALMLPDVVTDATDALVEASAPGESTI